VQGFIGTGLATLLTLSPGVDLLHQGAVTYLNRVGSSWFWGPNQAEPRAQATVQQYLDRLKAAGIDPAEQGLWFQANWRVLAQHQGDRPLSAASLTKVATSLAALETWDPNHQFITEIWADGPIAQGTLQGNLIVRGGGDPMFVWEEAIALGNALQQLGINRVTGDLVIEGRFEMNFLPDPEDPNPPGPALGGTLLRQGINGAAWSPLLTRVHGTMPPGTAKPQVVIAGTVRPALDALPSASPNQLPNATATPGTTTPVAGRRLLIRHRSLPLLSLLKQMNLYSNNFMAETLARQMGGGVKVAQQLRSLTGLSETELRSLNGSGLGQGNAFSPRAITAIGIALERRLQVLGIPEGVAALLPMAGRDRGTIARRKMPTGSAVKTGSLFNVSALSGFLPTRDRGLVWFSIQNRSTKVNSLRAEQDKLLTDLQTQWGGPPQPVVIPPPIEPFLGDPSRNEPIQT